MNCTLTLKNKQTQKSMTYYNNESCKPTKYHANKTIFQRRQRFYNIKEQDVKISLYYYEARYLDPRTSRWLGVDPAMHQGDYIPSAPIDDEARKRNGNLPGQGGIYNVNNLHTYAYTHNNPVKYTDPDGKMPRRGPTNAMQLTPDNIMVGIGSGGRSGGGGGYSFGVGKVASPKATTAPNAPNIKPSSPGKMQREVERGQSPRNIDRVDKGHIPNQEPHVHYSDGGSSTQSGKVHDRHKGILITTNEVKMWLEKHGWKTPKTPNE